VPRSDNTLDSVQRYVTSRSSNLPKYRRLRWNMHEQRMSHDGFLKAIPNEELTKDKRAVGDRLTVECNLYLNQHIVNFIRIVYNVTNSSQRQVYKAVL